MLEHGGRLRRAAMASGSRPEEWIDLSTGISPYPWPIPEIPAECWSRLPEDEDGLIEAACKYYGATSLLAVDGTQCAIQLLPHLRQEGRVAVVSPCYAEHAHAWRQNGHAVSELDFDEVDANLDEFDVVVVVNPNNPTGEYRSLASLKRWHESLQNRGAWLIVDEAFMDMTPEWSMTAESGAEGLIVLRSFGKFFGCPGARLGFAAAETGVLEALRELAGPWPIAGPARWVGRMALSDFAWHKTARLQLAQTSEDLAELLRQNGLPPTGGTPLFQWTKTDRAQAIYEHLLSHRILVRWFSQPSGLRSGLPGKSEDWQRLGVALQALPEGLAGFR